MIGRGGRARPHRHHRYASSVALMQIAVALSAIAALLAQSPPLDAVAPRRVASATVFFLDGFLLFF